MTDVVHLEDGLCVWRAPLDVGPSRFRCLKALLSPDECQRAERFFLRQHRDRFIVARGVLRMLLASFLEMPAGDIAFARSNAGKPSLLRQAGASRVEFNVAHSNGVGLFVIARDHPVGVDIEHARRDHPFSAAAEAAFTRSERLELQALPPEHRAAQFFRVWTAKEACLKAIGCGWSHGPECVEVSTSPGGPLRLCRVCGETAPTAWRLLELDVGTGFAAALAVQPAAS